MSIAHITSAHNSLQNFSHMKIVVGEARMCNLLYGTNMLHWNMGVGADGSSERKKWKIDTGGGISLRSNYIYTVKNKII